MCQRRKRRQARCKEATMALSIRRLHRGKSTPITSRNERGRSLASTVSIFVVCAGRVLSSGSQPLASKEWSLYTEACARPSVVKDGCQHRPGSSYYQDCVRMGDPFQCRSTSENCYGDVCSSANVAQHGECPRTSAQAD